MPKTVPSAKRIDLLLDEKNLFESKIGELVYKLKEPINDANIYKVGLADTNLKLLDVVLLEVKFSKQPEIEDFDKLTVDALNTLRIFASIEQYDDESEKSALKEIRETYSNIKALVPFMKSIRRSEIELALETISFYIPQARSIKEDFKRLPVYIEHLVIMHKAEQNKDRREVFQRIYDEWTKYNFLVTDVVDGFRLSLPPLYEMYIKIESMSSDVLNVDSETKIVSHADYILNLAKDIKIKCNVISDEHRDSPVLAVIGTRHLPEHIAMYQVRESRISHINISVDNYKNQLPKQLFFLLTFKKDG